MDGPEGPYSTDQIVVLDADTGALLAAWSGLTAGDATLADGLIAYIEVAPSGERRLVTRPVP